MRYRGQLFSDGTLGAWLDARAGKLGEAAAEIPADHALATSAEVLADELVRAFRVDPVALDEKAIYLDHQDERIDARELPNRFIRDPSRPFYIPGTRFTLHVPFSGDADLFRLRASKFTNNPPMAEVSGEDLLISLAVEAPATEGVKQRLLGELDKTKLFLGWTNADVAEYNARLPQGALAAATARREKLRGDHDLVASFGIPVRRADAPRTYAAPPVRRPTPVQPRGAKAHKLEPVLPAEEYEHILRIASRITVVMERSPRSFARMREEGIRDHILVQLNGHYEGDATGETFSFDGKTDIYIQRDGGRTFIAECKFWSGPKKLGETIDQILGYLTWRDTKSAIFVLNRGRELSAVLRQISPTVVAHPAFVREIPRDGETDFRFVLRHRDDPERELTVSILVFEVPA